MKIHACVFKLIYHELYNEAFINFLFMNFIYELKVANCIFEFLFYFHLFHIYFGKLSSGESNKYSL